MSIKLHVRELRTVQREHGTARRLTSFEREHGARRNRPARASANRAAITASAVGAF